MILPTLHDVALAIASEASPHGRWRVVLEGLFVPSASRASRILTLAESAGEVLGPLRGDGVIARPLASEWRGKVLRLGATSADAAEEYAIRCVPVVGRGMGALASNGHAAEALCLAYFGTVVDRSAAMVLGIDPGADGAAVLVAQGPAPVEVLGAWAWAKRRHGWSLEATTAARVRG